MEMVKNVIKQYYLLLMILACVLFVIHMFFSFPIQGGKGVFEGGGSIYTSMIEKEDAKLESMDAINKKAFSPSILYNAGVHKVGSSTEFKSLFLVQIEDGSFIEGNIEDGFSLYLKDIVDERGCSVLEVLPTDVIFSLEEIPAPFVYDREEDILYFYSSGIYTIYLKIYGPNGEQIGYEVMIPVDTM